MSKTSTKISVALALGLTLFACGGDTGRARTELTIEAQGRIPYPLPSVHGYDITLSQAEIALGEIAFFEGDPLFSARPRWTSWLISTAYAHPGHYEPGEALAEVDGPLLVDLLGPPIRATGSGVTGSYRSAHLRLEPALSGASIVLSGTATKGSTTQAFSASLALSETIEGINAGFSVDASQSTVRFRVDLSSWLERIDFSLLPPNGGAIDESTQPYSALLRGIRKTSSYLFDNEETNL